MRIFLYVVAVVLTGVFIVLGIVNSFDYMAILSNPTADKNWVAVVIGTVTSLVMLEAERRGDLF